MGIDQGNTAGETAQTERGKVVGKVAGKDVLDGHFHRICRELAQDRRRALTQIDGPDQQGQRTIRFQLDGCIAGITRSLVAAGMQHESHSGSFFLHCAYLPRELMARSFSGNSIPAISAAAFMDSSAPAPRTT